MSTVYSVAPLPDESKRCRECLAIKPLAEFGAHKTSKGGRLARCKACVSQQAAAYRKRHSARISAANRARYEANPEPAKARANARRKADPEAHLLRKQEYVATHVEQVRAYRRRWYLAHRDEVRARAKARALADPAGKRAYQRAWLMANRDKDHARYQRRRARKVNAPVVDLTAQEWSAILAYFAYRCAYCLRPCDRLQQEHMVPLSKGGSHTASNIVPACPDCNQSKGTKTPLEWLWSGSAKRIAPAFRQERLPLFGGGR